MEGLIPFVYRAVVQYRNGKGGAIGSWLCESPSYSYVRLAGGDSGRFQTSSSSALFSDYGFSAANAPPSSKSSSSSPSNNSSSCATQPIVQSSGVHQSSSSPLKLHQASA